MSFTEIFRLYARLRPGKPALVHGGMSFGCAELDRVIDHACFALADHGARRGELVASPSETAPSTSSCCSRCEGQPS